MIQAIGIADFVPLRNKFVDILKELVSLPSCTGDKEDINRFMDFAQSLFSRFNQPIRRTATPGGDILQLDLLSESSGFVVLLAHADTVCSAEGEVQISVTGDTFRGCGAYDMKSAIALFFFVLEKLQNRAGKFPLPLKMIITPDEENNSPHSKPYLLRECQGASCVILPEPSCPDGAVKTRRKAVAALEAKIQGRAAHSGIEPELGLDANRSLAALITTIDSLVSRYPGLSFNPGLVSGGVGSNVVAPWSRLSGELRSENNEVLADAVSRLQKITVIGETPVTLTVTVQHPALEFDGKNRRLFDLASGISSDLGRELNGCTSGGGSDGSSLSFAGIPVIDGLGMKGGGAHSPDEFVDLADFPFRAALLTRLCLEVSRD